VLASLPTPLTESNAGVVTGRLRSGDVPLDLLLLFFVECDIRLNLGKLGVGQDAVDAGDLALVSPILVRPELVGFALGLVQNLDEPLVLRPERVCEKPFTQARSDEASS